MFNRIICLHDLLQIFESKGELGVFCNLKKHVTKPQEFHFATNERIPPPPTVVADLFDKVAASQVLKVVRVNDFKYVIILVYFPLAALNKFGNSQRESIAKKH